MQMAMKKELTAERRQYRLAGTLGLCAPENGVYAGVTPNGVLV